MLHKSAISLSAIGFCLFVHSFAGATISALNSSALAYNGIIVSDLPRGGNVTVPGRYPILIPPQTEVLISGLNSPQAVTITNSGEAVSRVQIFAMHETKTRTLAIQPGTSTVYNFNKMKPIRVKVLDGKIEISSLDPVRIQR